MRENRKFAKKARNRKVMAFFLATAVVTSIFAAITYGENLQELLPEFLQEYLDQKPDVPQA